MTPITDTAEAAPVAAATEVAVEKMLRDMAYVLRLTRRVKAEMAAERLTAQDVVARAWERVLLA